MNQERLITTLALAATLAFSIPAVQAEYLTPSFEAKLQAAADGGPAQVNQLLYRTRAVYNVSMDEAMQHVQGQGSEAETTGTTDIDQGGGFAPADAAQSQDDAFTREFFRNDARD